MSRTIRSNTPTSRARIPEGQYGAGTVEIWDRGTWEPVGDPEAAMRKGDFKFVLHGERLNGRFVLVRMKPRPKEHAENWLLIKEHDGLEREGVSAAEMEAEKPSARRPEEEPAREKRAAKAKPAAPAPASALADPPHPRGSRALARHHQARSRRLLARIADAALPGIAHRPLALVRCPEGIGGEHFFQKHRSRGMPAAIREGHAGPAPIVAIDDLAGLIACAQFSAIELHTWGCTEDDPQHADRLVFDLDPGEGVTMDGDRARRARGARPAGKLGLESFCRTSGGKGLHVVAPLSPRPDWDALRPWCHEFAREMEADAPDRFVSTVPKERRRGHILVDWLRNGLGSTAVASYCRAPARTPPSRRRSPGAR